MYLIHKYHITICVCNKKNIESNNAINIKKEQQLLQELFKVNRINATDRK